MKKRSLLLLIGLAALTLTIAMALPASHYFIVGILRQESFYNGRPTSYWIDALKHEPFARRSAPAQDIGKYLREGGFEALPVLRQMVHDQDTEVSLQARMVISLIVRDADSSRIPELLSLAKDRDSQMRQAALQTLGRMQPEPADKVPTLAEALLGDDDPQVRAAAAFSLKNTRERIDEAAAALHAALADPDKAVRFTAAKTLASMERHQADLIPVFLEALKEPRPRADPAIEELGKMGQKARVVLPALLELLQTGETDAAYNAASLLVLLGFREELIETLIRLLKEGSPQARLNAAGQLLTFARSGKLAVPVDAKVMVPVLLELLQIDSTRRGAVSLIRQIGSAAKESVPGLADLLKTEKDPRLRMEVLDALAGIGTPSAISVLLRGLDDPESKVRLQTSKVLLTRLLVNDEFRPHALSALVALLKDEDEDVACEAARYLAGMGSQAKKALPGLQAASKDPRVRVSLAATTALTAINAKEAPSSGKK